jgi:hypothetical protein
MGKVDSWEIGRYVDVVSVKVDGNERLGEWRVESGEWRVEGM